MLRQYTPSYEKAKELYIHNFAYTGEEYPDERLTFPFAILSEFDELHGFAIIECIAVWNGY